MLFILILQHAVYQAVTISMAIAPNPTNACKYLCNCVYSYVVTLHYTTPPA